MVISSYEWKLLEWDENPQTNKEKQTLKCQHQINISNIRFELSERNYTLL